MRDQPASDELLMVKRGDAEDALASLLSIHREKPSARLALVTKWLEHSLYGHLAGEERMQAMANILVVMSRRN